MAFNEAKETNSPLTFADAFWDDGDQGIRRINEKLQASQQTCQEIASLYEHRAKIEEDYGERLLQLSQMMVGQAEEGTLAKSISHIPSALEITARAHADLAQQLRQHLKAPLDDFMKEHSERRATQQKRIEHSNQEKTTCHTNAALARDYYMGECSKLKSMERYINERSTDMIPDEIQQVKEEIEEERRLVEKADLEFKNATEALAKANEQWINDWREACVIYQELEESRINFTRSSLWAFANMMSSVYIVDDQCCERIRTTLESTDVRKDIHQFIKDYGTGNKMPDIIRYENYLNPTLPAELATEAKVKSEQEPVRDVPTVSVTPPLETATEVEKAAEAEQPTEAAREVTAEHLAEVERASEAECTTETERATETGHAAETQRNAETDPVVETERVAEAECIVEEDHVATKEHTTEIEHISEAACVTETERNAEEECTTDTKPIAEVEPVAETEPTTKVDTAPTAETEPVKEAVQPAETEAPTRQEAAPAVESVQTVVPPPEPVNEQAQQHNEPLPSDQLANQSQHREPVEHAPSALPPILTMLENTPSTTAASEDSKREHVLPPTIQTAQNESQEAVDAIPKSPASVVSPGGDSVMSSVNGYEFVEYARHHDDDLPAQSDLKHSAMDAAFQQIETMLETPITHDPADDGSAKPQPLTIDTGKETGLNAPAPLYDSFDSLPNPHIDQQQRSISSPLPLSEVYTQREQELEQDQKSEDMSPVEPPRRNSRAEKWTISTIRRPQQLAIQTQNARIYDRQSIRLGDTPTQPPLPVHQEDVSATAQAAQQVLATVRAQLHQSTNSSPTYSTLGRGDSFKSSTSNDSSSTGQTTTEGIRPPPWQENKREFSRLQTGIRRKNSVVGPRAPPRIDTDLTTPMPDTMLAYENMGAQRSESPEPSSKSNIGIGFMKHVFTNKSSNNLSTSQRASVNLGKPNRSSHNLSVLPSPLSPSPSKEKNSRFSIGIFGKKRKDDNETSQPAPVEHSSAQERSPAEQLHAAVQLPILEEGRLPDGTPVLFYAGAQWDYTAKIPSELSFTAGDRFAVLYEHSDGWWEAELLDPIRRNRGLIPGNYMRRF